MAASLLCHPAISLRLPVAGSQRPLATSLLHSVAASAGHRLSAQRPKEEGWLQQGTLMAFLAGKQPIQVTIDTVCVSKTLSNTGLHLNSSLFYALTNDTVHFQIQTRRIQARRTLMQRKPLTF
jgi:hypothetical protein